jgi:hypothetical protein
MWLPPRSLISIVLLTATPMLASSCQKETSDLSQAPSADSAPADAVDQAADKLIAALGAKDDGAIKELASGPLATDMSAEAFHDMHIIVEWLGYVKSKRQIQEDIPVQEGGVRRTYIVEFEKEEVILEVTVLEDGQVMGFHFSGDGFYRAEHGVIADEFRVFKVYDFHWVDPQGSEHLPGDAIVGTHVAYHVVVGGIEAFGGKHHIAVKKMVRDAKGNEIFVEPIEYDVKFAANAEGIPRGDMSGEFDVPGPGDYELVLTLRDDIAVVEVEHRVPFTVVAASE